MTGFMNGASVHSNGTSSGPAEVHAVPVLTRLAATTASQDLAQDHLRSFGGETSETRLFNTPCGLFVCWVQVWSIAVLE